MAFEFGGGVCSAFCRAVLGGITVIDRFGSDPGLLDMMSDINHNKRLEGLYLEDKVFPDIPNCHDHSG